MKLTHFPLMFHFYTPMKTWENRRFSDVFRGYRVGTLVENGLQLMTSSPEHSLVNLGVIRRQYSLKQLAN